MRAVRRWVFDSDAPALAACAFLIALTIKSHGRFIWPEPVFAGSDEGYIAAFAHRLLEGRLLPFVDAVSHRGPLLYWLAAAFVVCFGKGWLPIRLASLSMHVLTVVLTLACGMRGGRALAGALGALSFTLCCAVLLDWDNGHAFNGEYPLNVFAMGGMLCVTWALGSSASHRSRMWLVASGAALTSMGALCKQVGALHHGPLILWVAAAAVARVEWPRRSRIQLTVAYAAGAVVPVAMVVVIYAIAGELRALHYWSIVYNTRVYLRAYPRSIRWTIRQRWVLDNLLVFSLLLPLASAQLVRVARTARRIVDLPQCYDRDGFAFTVTLQALAAAFSVQAGLRFWGHYYAQLAPWLGLALGVMLEPVPHGPRRGLMQWAVLAPLCALLGFSWVTRSLAEPPVTVVAPPICAEIQKYVRPHERLFVWGFAPDLHVTCERRAASRYVFTGLAVGYLANLHEPATPEKELVRSPPGGRKTLLADLEASRPPLILNSVFYGMRRMQEYPEYAPFLDRHYCPARYLHGVEAFVRRAGNGRCDSR